MAVHRLGSTLAGNVGICVCRLHPPNDRHLCLSPTCRDMSADRPTGWRHSVKSAYFFADKILSGNRIPDTIFYVYVGIGTIHGTIFLAAKPLPC